MSSRQPARLAHMKFGDTKGCLNKAAFLERKGSRQLLPSCGAFSLGLAIGVLNDGGRACLFVLADASRRSIAGARLIPRLFPLLATKPGWYSPVEHGLPRVCLPRVVLASSIPLAIACSKQRAQGKRCQAVFFLTASSCFCHVA